MKRGHLSIEMSPNGNAIYKQLPSVAMIAVDQGTNCVAAVFNRQFPRGSADAALEVIATHAGSGADSSFLNAASFGTVQSFKNVLFLHVSAANIVESAVIALTYDGKIGIVCDTKLRRLVEHPRNQCIVASAYRQSIREKNRGSSRSPDSAIQSKPVTEPLPFRTKEAALTR